jgi:hypothetical protein
MRGKQPRLRGSFFPCRLRRSAQKPAPAERAGRLRPIRRRPTPEIAMTPLTNLL